MNLTPKGLFFSFLFWSFLFFSFLFFSFLFFSFLFFSFLFFSFLFFFFYSLKVRWCYTVPMSVIMPLPMSKSEQLSVRGSCPLSIRPNLSVSCSHASNAVATELCLNYLAWSHWLPADVNNRGLRNVRAWNRILVRGLHVSSAGLPSWLSGSNAAEPLGDVSWQSRLAAERIHWHRYQRLPALPACSKQLEQHFVTCLHCITDQHLLQQGWQKLEAGFGISVCHDCNLLAEFARWPNVAAGSLGVWAQITVIWTPMAKLQGLFSLLIHMCSPTSKQLSTTGIHTW